MLDGNIIATYEKGLRQTRVEQNRLIARLREVEAEAEHLREQISALEVSAKKTESLIDGLLITMRSGGTQSQNLGSGISIEDDAEAISRSMEVSELDFDTEPLRRDSQRSEPYGKITYINQRPSRTKYMEAVSNRFSDRTITQACTLLLRESGGPLHVNELYNLLVAGGMEFKGNNPTISIAVSLNRNRRFRKVEPGTFDLVMREAAQRAS